MIKIKDLKNGMIIWNNKNEILGIVGVTLPDDLYDKYCIKLEGNEFDYLLVERKGE